MLYDVDLKPKSLEQLQWLVALQPPSQHGHLSQLVLACSRGCRTPPSAADWLKQLGANKWHFRPHTAEVLASGGNSALARRMDELFRPFAQFVPSMVIEASRKGRLEMLEWLWGPKKHNMPRAMAKVMLSLAIRHHHCDILARFVAPDDAQTGANILQILGCGCGVTENVVEEILKDMRRDDGTARYRRNLQGTLAWIKSAAPQMIVSR